MKNNIFKYIFVVFAIGLIAFAIYFFYQQDKESSQNQNPTTEIKQEPNIATDMRLAIVGFDSINPILSNNKNVQDITKLIFEPLLTLDENYHLQPCLATEWSKTGDTSYVLKLRKGVKWQSGIEFTARDVQYTVDQLKTVPSIYAYNVQHVISVEVIDDYTVKFTVDVPISFFEYNLTFPIVSKDFYEGQEFSTATGNNLPVSTGRYRVASNEGKTITLKKNQSWWKIGEENSKIETILVNLYDSMGEVYNAFKMGNIDMLSTESLNLEEYIGTIGYQKKEIKGRELDFIVYNSANAFLGRTEVRRAVSYAIDRNAVIANVYGAKYKGVDFPLDFGTWAYTEEAGSSGYNPEQAKQVLIDGGWEYKYGNWQKKEEYKTIKLSLYLLVNSDDARKVAAAELIQQNLETVGIKVKINKANTSRFQTALDNGNYDMVLMGVNTGLSPDLTTYYGSTNLANYQNEEVSSLMRDIPNITDDNLLKEKIIRLAQIQKEEMPYMFLYFNPKNVIYSTNLIGDVTPNNYQLFYHFENWYRQY